MTFVQITAQQLALEYGRDTPNDKDKDLAEAKALVEGINFRREVIYGLEPIT